ncbi:MAG: hypothetical protein DRH56_10290 [Deltaproteobacteria bacterium]|nr:MAG: hypothetical protein DRH56_10290 [Deltaproteobacteria bacterium]
MNRRILVSAVIAIAVMGMIAGCATGGASFEKVSDNPVILIAAFGSSYETGQKNLEDFDSAVRGAFPDSDVYWGFTASFIVNKLEKQGVTTLFDRQVPIIKIGDAFNYLKDKGHENVVVINFLNMVGAEYREVLDTPTSGLNVKYVHPLLYYPENIQNAVLALVPQFGDPVDTATIFCAHGNEKELQFNAELIQIDNYLRENYDNTYLAVMEGTPEFSRVKEEVLSNPDIRKVQFIAFMLTFGDHMSNDVMGDEEDSFKMQLGLPAEITDGMASNPAMQKLFIDRARIVYSQFME